MTAWLGGWTPSELSNVMAQVYHDYDGAVDNEQLRLDWIRVQVTYTADDDVTPQGRRDKSRR